MYGGRGWGAKGSPWGVWEYWRTSSYSGSMRRKEFSSGTSDGRLKLQCTVSETWTPHIRHDATRLEASAGRNV